MSAYNVKRMRIPYLKKCLLISLLAFALPASASNQFSLSKYGTSVIDDSVIAQAAFTFDLPPDVRAALDRSVELIFEIDVEVYNPQEYLPNKTLVDINIKKRLSYHALTEKYTVDDITFGQRNSYNNLEDALNEIGRAQVNLTDASVLRATSKAIIRLRINLSILDLPLPLRLPSTDLARLVLDLTVVRLETELNFQKVPRHGEIAVTIEEKPFYHPLSSKLDKAIP